MKEIEIVLHTSTLKVSIIDDTFGPINSIILEKGDYSILEIIEIAINYIDLFDYPYRKISLLYSAAYEQDSIYEIYKLIEDSNKVSLMPSLLRNIEYVSLKK